MRINRFIALATGVGRRQADTYIASGRVVVNGLAADTGQIIHPSDVVLLDSKPITIANTYTTVMLNKPMGYVCSRRGQGSKTIYQLLPRQYQQLKPVGRLDKDSSGLLLLTDDGTLAYGLTHPSQKKEKAYEVRLDKPLSEHDRKAIQTGVRLYDGLSKLTLDGQDDTWEVTMHEGRNRQIRRTFKARGYEVLRLHRTQFGNHSLGTLQKGQYREIKT